MKIYKCINDIEVDGIVESYYKYITKNILNMTAEYNALPLRLMVSCFSFSHAPFAP